jgi:polyhydroxyalkanoate synthesis regulator phasin
MGVFIRSARQPIFQLEGTTMAEPENQTLHILREIRTAIKTLETRVDLGFASVDTRFDQLGSRMDNIRQALTGESVLGRYAAAEVEERLEAIEKRIAALENAD